jgi:hypothetical protein
MELDSLLGWSCGPHHLQADIIMELVSLVGGPVVFMIWRQIKQLYFAHYWVGPVVPIIYRQR